MASWTEPEILGKQLTDQDHLLFNTSLETLVTRCILAVPKTGLMGIDIFSMNILSSVPPIC